MRQFKKRVVQSKIEGANNSTSPRASEPMMMELLQSQRRKVEAASLSPHYVAVISEDCLGSSFHSPRSAGKEKPMGNNGVDFNCSGHRWVPEKPSSMAVMETKFVQHALF